MANLLKPSVDQIVFSQSWTTQPARRRSDRETNVSVNAGFLAHDDAEPKLVAGLVRAAGTAVAVLIAALVSAGRI